MLGTAEREAEITLVSDDAVSRNSFSNTIALKQCLARLKQNHSGSYPGTLSVFVCNLTNLASFIGDATEVVRGQERAQVRSSTWTLGHNFAANLAASRGNNLRIINSITESTSKVEVSLLPSTDIVGISVASVDLEHIRARCTARDDIVGTFATTGAGSEVLFFVALSTEPILKAKI